jgi:hypothetical protein
MLPAFKIFNSKARRLPGKSTIYLGHPCWKSLLTNTPVYVDDRATRIPKGLNMAKQHEAECRQRRSFLKAAGGAALTFVATKHAYGQTVRAAVAAQEEGRRTEPADRGVWVTWYDLPEQGRDAYFSWLHDAYLPDLLKRPRYLWAAHYASQEREGGSNSSQIHHVEDPNVPTGYHYILLIGAEDADVFGNPVPSALHASLPERDRKMLAMRMGERINIMAEAGRCEGGTAKAYKEGLTGAPCIQIGSFNCPVEYEEEMHAGYVQQRLPAMCETASCIRTRKLNSVVGWAKHAILYEFTSLEGYKRDYPAALKKSPLGSGGHSVVPMLIHAPGGPNSALRIWPPVPKA